MMKIWEILIPENGRTALRMFCRDHNVKFFGTSKPIYFNDKWFVAFRFVADDYVAEIIAKEAKILFNITSILYYVVNQEACIL